MNCCLQGFQGFVLVVYLLFGSCYYFQASKGKGGVCGHLLGLSINNMVAMLQSLHRMFIRTVWL